MVAMHAFPYLRDQQGSAGFHRHHWQGWLAEFSPALLLLAGLSGLQIGLGAAPWWWLGWLGALPAVVLPLGLGRRLGGHSGDSYGACVEWSVSWTLLLLGLLLRLGA